MLGSRMCAVCTFTTRQHSSTWNDFTSHFMHYAFIYYDVKSKIRLCQSMCIYVRNIPGKCHSDPIWNDGAFGFYLKRLPQREQEGEEEKQEKTRWIAIMRLVPGLKRSENEAIINPFPVLWSNKAFFINGHKEIHVLFLTENTKEY